MLLNPLDWRSFEKEDLLKHKDFLAQVKMRGVDVNQLTLVDVVTNP